MFPWLAKPEGGDIGWRPAISPALATSITHAPQGQAGQMVNGCAGTGCTQIQETYDYNDRLQPVRIQLGSSSSHAADNCAVYNYYSGVANPTRCAVPSQGTSGNDGSIVGHFYQDTANSSLGHTQSLTYDSLDRLGTSVATGSATHNLTFNYDRYGNMTCVVNGQTQGLCPTYTFSSTSNRITNSNYTYDSSGDLTQNGTGTGTYAFQWDAEGRMKTSTPNGGSTTTYIYNAFGQRVEKQTGTTYLEYIYDPSGLEVSTNPRQSFFTHHYLFLGGRRFGKYTSNVTYFIHGDNLGTTTTGTDYTGSIAMGWDQLYYPWGQKWGSPVGTVNDTRFASLHARDTESNLDKTHFRMFSSDEGRWLGADPKAGCGMNPQNHNRYAYVVNRPTALTDPSGLDGGCTQTAVYTCKTYCTDPQGGEGSKATTCQTICGNFMTCVSQAPTPPTYLPPQPGQPVTPLQPPNPTGPPPGTPTGPVGGGGGSSGSSGSPPRSSRIPLPALATVIACVTMRIKARFLGAAWPFAVPH